jgi:DNA-binding HxlR family transcriptional regulator
MATKSVAAQREAAREAYNIYFANCPSRQVLAMLSDKWVTMVIGSLHDGPLRYSELRRFIAGISQKMLTQTLRTLERDGLVSRTITPAVPVRVDYALTDVGRTLLPVILQITNWAETHIEEIQQARAAYDGEAEQAQGA